MPAEPRAVLEQAARTLERLTRTTWAFGDSVGVEGLLAASEVLDDDRYAAFARGLVRGWATRRHPFVRLDCTAPGKAMVELARRWDDPTILEAAIELAAYLRRRPELDGVYATWEHSPLQHPWGPATLAPAEVALLAAPPAGVFVDCLHFDPPFFTALGRLTGDAALVADGVRQALGYVRLLQRADGLFEHFVLDGAATTYGPGWGRGQGWALLGLLDVLDAIDDAEPGRAELVEATGRLVDAMRRTQRPDGGWFAVVDEPASGDEHSTAAFMADGFARAVAGGVVSAADHADVLAAASAALAAVLAATDADGQLTCVSAAVNACTEPSHYAHVPCGFVVPWGQGPLALAIATHLRLGEPS
jgi:unsaturated rhamnogalacturonyl hydrolase